MAKGRDDRSQPELSQSDRNLDERTQSSNESALDERSRDMSGSSRNETVDAAVELSERGGITPEELDPERYHDRSRDREIDREVL